MPSLEEHISLSRMRAGKEWREVHEWVDGRGLSRSQRLARHNIFMLGKNMRAAERMFGSDGAKEYFHHICEDYEAGVLRKSMLRLALLATRTMNRPAGPERQQTRQGRFP